MTSEAAMPLIFRQRVNYTITTGGSGLHIKAGTPAGQLINILTNYQQEPTMTTKATTPAVTYVCGCPLIERDGQQFADIHHECQTTPQRNQT